MGPRLLLGDGGAVGSRVEIKQPLEVRAVGELLVFAVFVFLAKALAARQRESGGQRRASQCRRRSS